MPYPKSWSVGCTKSAPEPKRDPPPAPLSHAPARPRAGSQPGMLIVETIAKIRRLFRHEHKSIREISRELRLSRKVVRKALRSDATAFAYTGSTACSG